MFQHITASSNYEDYIVGEWPPELGDITDTQVRCRTRLRQTQCRNTVACARHPAAWTVWLVWASPNLRQPHVWELRRPLLPRETRSLGSLAL